MSAEGGVAGEVGQVYKHSIYVNIAGQAKKPILSLWCADCLVAVQDFDQNNPWDDVRLAVDEHCSRMSERERLSTPPASTTPTATDDGAHGEGL